MTLTVTPVLVINYIDFQNALKGDIQSFINQIEEQRVQAKALTKFRWDSNIHRFSNIFGQEFSFLIYKDSLSAWDQTGGVSIYKTTFKDHPTDEMIADLMLASEEWTRGNVHCSDCGSLQAYQGIRGQHYFAGIYCNNCWNNKWKAIEAKENYN